MKPLGDSSNDETKPLERVLSLVRVKPYSKGYLAHCPAHRDTEESLTIWEDSSDEHVGIKCYAGCSRRAVVEALGLQETDLYRRDRPRALPSGKAGITVLDLMVAKGIHPTLITNEGLEDITYKHRPAVRIPYREASGSEHSRSRIRTALVAKEGSYWSEGTDPPIAYGLHRLATARQAGYLILVEGESDCWTLWQAGYPALGVPGATAIKCLTKDVFEGIDRVFVMAEPDTAGTALPANVSKALRKLGYTGTIFALNLAAVTGAKDPNELHVREWNIPRFKALMQQALDEAHDVATLASSEHGDLPEILTNNVQLRDTIDEAVSAIVQAEGDHPTLFMQASRLVRVGRDEKYRPIIVQMGVAEVKEVLTHAANFYRLKKVAGEEGLCEKVSVSPPKEIAEQILARQVQKPYLPFPPLDTIVETPVMRPDGSLLSRPGYDKKTRLYYAEVTGMEECMVPEHPTPGQREAALQLIWSAFGEFPYASDADRANALALLLTPFIRPAVRRHVPLALVDAPKRGTGKGLLTDGVTIIATGDTAPVLTMSENGDELQKAITSLLIEGATIIIIDNIVECLQSKHLDAVLTSDTWRGRILGVSKMARVPNRATWIATGNNISLGGDLPSRCYRIRLDARVSRPEKRKDFTHKDLASWIKEHRVELVQALLILARAWYVAGKPEDEQLPAMRTFTGWVKIVGGILKYAGVTGFLANLDELQEQSDEEATQWEMFFSTWTVRFADKWITTAEICAVLSPPNDVAGVCRDNEPNLLLEALPEWLQIALKEKPTSFKLRLARALEKRVDACFGEENLRLEKRLEKHSKKVLWRVLRGFAGVSFSPSQHEFLESVSRAKRKNESENDRIKPPQTSANGQVSDEPKMGNGSRGGSVQSDNEQIPAISGHLAKNTNETPAKIICRCATHFEERHKVAHEVVATTDDEARAFYSVGGCDWCERCAPQRAWIGLGAQLDYPKVVISSAGFQIKAGYESWLKFAQEAGYALVREALTLLLESEERSQASPNVDRTRFP